MHMGIHGCLVPAAESNILMLHWPVWACHFASVTFDIGDITLTLEFVTVASACLAYSCPFGRGAWACHFVPLTLDI